MKKIICFLAIINILFIICACDNNAGVGKKEIINQSNNEILNQTNSPTSIEISNDMETFDLGDVQIDLPVKMNQVLEEVATRSGGLLDVDGMILDVQEFESEKNQDMHCVAIHYKASDDMKVSPNADQFAQLINDHFLYQNSYYKDLVTNVSNEKYYEVYIDKDGNAKQLVQTIGIHQDGTIVMTLENIINDYEIWILYIKTDIEKNKNVLENIQNSLRKKGDMIDASKIHIVQ